MNDLNEEQSPVRRASKGSLSPKPQQDAENRELAYTTYP